MMNSRRPRGRRGGTPDTRAHILEIARDRFLSEGYRAVTLRSLAADADVDVALISYHFGSKRGLFAAALDLVVNPADVLRTALQGDPDTLGPRTLRAVLLTWDHPVAGPSLQVAFRAAVADPAVGAVLRGALETELLATLADHLGGADARTRAGLFAAQIAGVIASRYLLGIEPIASMDVDEIVRRLGPALTHTLRAPARRIGRTGRGG